jgi:hypothetical protein
LYVGVRPVTVPAMTSVGQFVLVLLGLVLLVCGILFGALGVWAITLHSPGAWKVAVVGFSAAIIGGALMKGTRRRKDEPKV